MHATDEQMLAELAEVEAAVADTRAARRRMAKAGPPRGGDRPNAARARRRYHEAKSNLRAARAALRRTMGGEG